MTEKRMMEILNGVVEYTAIARDTTEQIQELIRLGFMPEELVDHFAYSKADVEYALACDDSDDDEEAYLKAEREGIQMY